MAGSDQYDSEPRDEAHREEIARARDAAGSAQGTEGDAVEKGMKDLWGVGFKATNEIDASLCAEIAQVPRIRYVSIAHGGNAESNALATFHGAGGRIVGWTVNDPGTMRRAFASLRKAVWNGK